jgi:hypothetical protein
MLMQYEWDLFVEHFSHVKDALGKPIDPEIFETVIALNALGMSTVRSCGGYLDKLRGLLLPWVDIDPLDADLAELIQEEVQLVESSRQVHQKMKRLREEQAGTTEIQRVQVEANEIYQRLRTVQDRMRLMRSELRTQLAGYLTEFYQGRHVAFDRRLILSGMGRTRLQSQGSFDFYANAQEHIQQQKLEEYREEMRAFTDFLKKIYYAQ